MGMLSGLVKAGIAKKVFDEAKKPHNQRKAKELFSQLTNKSGKGRGSSGGTSGTTRY